MMRERTMANFGVCISMLFCEHHYNIRFINYSHTFMGNSVIMA
jgi:hypothetical protein